MEIRIEKNVYYAIQFSLIHCKIVFFYLCYIFPSALF